ncbi:PREDICTED: uncharacterized protein LOC108745360 isoform X2 [Trachymyrmex septentrionalis]|uniref:uncharacterized protein LOC108745360 isoform X2 n=1 Tax=Trachymyrmex septentrionalis TaxID=34720 RepID=UPI00084F1829|nr:PREDICTED: uncharacterized protein LOC108745360 isoform X2 [Trachymyrmex septentrionalis]
MVQKNQIMHETWLRRIGKNHKSHNGKFAKVCCIFRKIHLWYQKGNRKLQRTREDYAFYRAAIPTLFSTSIEKSFQDTAVNMDFKIIR